MAEEESNGTFLLGWRKMVAAFGSMVIIYLATAFVAPTLTGTEWVSVVYATMYIVLGLMGGNAISHVADAIGKK